MSRTRRAWLVGALGLGLVGALVWLGTRLPVAAWVEQARGVIEGWGAGGPVVFALVYALLVVCLVPGSPLSAAAGAAFGLPLAVATVYVGAVLGSSVALLLARGALRPRVERWLVAHPRLLALDELLGRHGAGVAFLLRLTPALPFTLLNYALGLTRLSLRNSLLASPAMLPGILLYASVGAAAGAAAEGAPDAGWRIALLAAGGVAAIVLSVWAARVATRITLPPAPPAPPAPPESLRPDVPPGKLGPAGTAEPSKALDPRGLRRPPRT